MMEWLAALILSRWHKNASEAEPLVSRVLRVGYQLALLACGQMDTGPCVNFRTIPQYLHSALSDLKAIALVSR